MLSAPKARLTGVSGAQCAANAVSLARRGADREFIADIGEQADVRVDPSVKPRPSSRIVAWLMSGTMFVPE